MSGFFVACDAGENDCPHGGWLHPECTEELRNLAREVIDNMGAWYCTDCQARIQKDEEEEKQLQEEQNKLQLKQQELADELEEDIEGDSQDDEDLRQLEAEVEAGKITIQQMQEDLNAADGEINHNNEDESDECQDGDEEMGEDEFENSHQQEEINEASDLSDDNQNCENNEVDVEMDEDEEEI